MANKRTPADTKLIKKKAINAFLGINKIDFVFFNQNITNRISGCVSAKACTVVWSAALDLKRRSDVFCVREQSAGAISVKICLFVRAVVTFLLLGSA